MGKNIMVVRLCVDKPSPVKGDRKQRTRKGLETDMISKDMLPVTHFLQ